MDFSNLIEVIIYFDIVKVMTLSKLNHHVLMRLSRTLGAMVGIKTILYTLNLKIEQTKVVFALIKSKMFY
jgi:hypothetical protein